MIHHSIDQYVILISVLYYLTVYPIHHAVLNWPCSQSLSQTSPLQSCPADARGYSITRGAWCHPMTAVQTRELGGRKT